MLFWLVGRSNCDAQGGRGVLDLSDSVIDKPLALSGTVIEVKRNYDEELLNSLMPVNIKQNASFQDVKFICKADFVDAFFEKWVLFSKAKFNSNADFNLAQFHNTVDFDNAKFEHIVDFNGVTFDSTVNFFFTHFGTSANFSNLKLSEKANFNFNSSILPDTLDFSSNLKISSEIDLTTANFTDSSKYNSKTDEYFKPHYIFLYKTDISKLRLDYMHFRLLFPNSFPVPTDAYHIDTRYSAKLSNDDKESIYEALLKNFSDRGQKESYKLLDIEYQKFKWDNSWASFLPCIPLYWNNFGYNKEQVFKWTLWLEVIFTLITMCCLNFLNNDVYGMKNIPIQNSITDKNFAKTLRNLIVRLWYSFVYSSNIFFRLTLRVEEIKYNRFWGAFYIMFMYTIGLICIAYMANFVLQK